MTSKASWHLHFYALIDEGQWKSPSLSKNSAQFPRFWVKFTKLAQVASIDYSSNMFVPTGLAERKDGMQPIVVGRRICAPNALLVCSQPNLQSYLRASPSCQIS